MRIVNYGLNEKVKILVRSNRDFRIFPVVDDELGKCTLERRRTITPSRRYQVYARTYEEYDFLFQFFEKEGCDPVKGCHHHPGIKQSLPRFSPKTMYDYQENFYLNFYVTLGGWKLKRLLGKLRKKGYRTIWDIPDCNHFEIY